MKKVFAVFFVLALAFMSINSSKVMAADDWWLGSNDADLYTSGGSQLLNDVGSKQPLYNGPGNPNVVGYVAWQTVTVKQAWFLINTSLGPKWVGYNGDALFLKDRLIAHAAHLEIGSKQPLYNGPGNPNVVGYVAYQPVKVKQAWYLINTSLGQKWIGYNL
ncbi:hypothetical protein [Bacillus cereus]|uniref:Uncharacterized protein n=1 Tax=Bacillus cereus TaxID=1396 RepID=A0A2B9DJY5_BACCE|nr:hypothetical protein [Bacillus cereus]PGM87786.1 hypothetical protein CN958_28755 [Bacillus cereus]